jgi:hypothetical protein
MSVSKLPFLNTTRLALLVFVPLLSGCYLASIHPIATPDQRVFDKELIGVWSSSHDTISISGENVDDLAFDVTEGPGALSDSSRTGSLSLLLTNIDDQTFMDVRPSGNVESDSPILEQMLMIPMHAIIRYTINGDTLSIQYLSYTEFKNLQDGNKLRGLNVEDVADDGPMLITSSTSEIRDFLADHKQDDNLYADAIHYVKVK